MARSTVPRVRARIVLLAEDLGVILEDDGPARNDPRTVADDDRPMTDRIESSSRMTPGRPNDDPRSSERPTTRDAVAAKVPAMRTWTATTTMPARPQDVLEVLTDPEACARWAPLPFDVEELDGRRLSSGTRARVSGKLAGRRVGFDVEVHEASGRGLSLAADGPVGFDVAYELAAVAGGSEVRASVSVRPSRGIAGRLLAEATSALLSAGALEAAVSRIAREAVAV
jgi:hypothetical protein